MYQQMQRCLKLVRQGSVGTATPSAPSSSDGTLNTRDRRVAQQWDERRFFAFYFSVVFASRLLLRSPCSNGLHWAFVMVLEDGMSLLSFVLGLFYLHHTNGAPLALLAKRMAASPEAAATAAAAMGAEEPQARPQVAAAPAPAPAAQQPPPQGGIEEVTRRSVRLFYFAM